MVPDKPTDKQDTSVTSPRDIELAERLERISPIDNVGRTDQRDAPQITEGIKVTDPIDIAPFTIPPTSLAMLLDPKNLDELEKLGGADGMLRSLGVDSKVGVSTAYQPASDDAPQWSATMEQRRSVYGRNELPVKKGRSVWKLMLIAFEQKILIILTVAAVVSLALGLYQDLGVDHDLVYTEDCPQGCEPAKVDWIEGVAIIIAVLACVLADALTNWQKEKQFQRLNEKKEDREIIVLRDGAREQVNIRDIVVGDIGFLEPGEVLPVDGIYLEGDSVVCDESAATGESNAINKRSFEECQAEKQRLGPNQSLKNDPFLVSGSKVLEGVGRYAVVSVGTNSFHGRIMTALQNDVEQTPLQVKLDGLADIISKAGAWSGGILFTGLMIRFFIALRTDSDRTPNGKAEAFIQNLILAVSLVVACIPEGLPLAITLALAYSTRQMTRVKLLVRVLASCETMANATVICTDKTGTLTQNSMTVVAATISSDLHFLHDGRGDIAEGTAFLEKDKLDLSSMNRHLSIDTQQLLNEAICINSTAFEVAGENQHVEFVGSKTEGALLRLAKDMQWRDCQATREQYPVIQTLPFSSQLKAMATIVRQGDTVRVYAKGAAEILVRQSSHIHAPPAPRYGQLSDVSTSSSLRRPLQAGDRMCISRDIDIYAQHSLRTLSLCYKDISVESTEIGDRLTMEDVLQGLTFIGMVGIEDPLRPGVREAVGKCFGAGVDVKMCTGDNIITAQSIARQAGILRDDGLVMNGIDFRAMNERERQSVVPRLRVLARSSPEDKRILVSTLRNLGEVVAVTGDGTNDAPALALAHVGFSMGIAGTEVAKEASDIVIMDDAFPNIVVAITWGRQVNDAVKKFLQFQLSVNIAAVVITFVSGVASAEQEAIFTAVQLLWVNMIMDTFAALALATDPATENSLDRPPDRWGRPLITVDMLKQMIIQAVYQIIWCLVLHFRGRSILQEDDLYKAELNTLVFNSFVFCQIFNQINCRRLDRKFNIFEGLHKNRIFLIVFVIMVGGQVLIIEVGGAAFNVQRLGGREWGISLIAGILSLPLGAFIRSIPTTPIQDFLVKYKLYPDPDRLPTIVPSAKGGPAPRVGMTKRVYQFIRTKAKARSQSTR